MALAESADAPVIFRGSPRSLRGAIHLVNRSGKKVKLNAAPIHSEHLKGPSLQPLSEVTFGARLAPGQEATVPAFLEIEPNTPPGIYQAEIEIDGQRQPVEAHVSEALDFGIQPDGVTILADNQLSFEREFEVENLGNIPLSTSKRLEATLITSVGVLESFQAGLKQAIEQDLKEKLKSMLNEYANQQVGTLVVTQEQFTLKPGEKRRTKAIFTLPSDLEPFRHYQAVLELYNASLTVDVYTTQGVSNDKS
jgi:hypothetical protein